MCLPQVRNRTVGRNFESDAQEENILWVPKTGCLHHNKSAETNHHLMNKINIIKGTCILVSPYNNDIYISKSKKLYYESKDIK